MKRAYIVMCFLLVAFVSMSSNYEAANQAYAEGDYGQAAELYTQVLEEEGIAPEVYYNLGNAYYKQNEIGKAILNYERALRLKPFYTDAKYNLQLAQQRVVDDIQNTQKSFLSVWIESLIQSLTSNVWAYISIGCFVACALLFLSFAFAKRLILRKFSFHMAVVFILVSLLTGIFAGVARHNYVERMDAIILQGVATVKSAPDMSGTDLFVLHEGTKVRIADAVGDWYEIHLANGNRGWIEKQMLERI